jgi:hypothetical protein
MPNYKIKIGGEFEVGWVACTDPAEYRNRIIHANPLLSGGGNFLREGLTIDVEVVKEYEVAVTDLSYSDKVVRVKATSVLEAREKAIDSCPAGFNRTINNVKEIK